MVESDDAHRARSEASSWLIVLDDAPNDEHQKARFKAWLRASPTHATAWDDVNRTNLLLTSRAVESAGHPHSALRRVFLGGAAAALAACLALAIVPKLWLHWTSDEVTGTAEVKSIRLDDGSIVRLGPETAFKLDLSAGQRRVSLLSGEALFDVVHDKARPFSVAAGGATITDLGTRFDVALVGNEVSVAVTRGSVRVEPATGKPFDLQTGDWARLGHDGSTETGAGVPEDLTVGPGSRIAARNRPVAEIIDRIRPWYPGRIILADAATGRRFVTGVFDAANPALALEALVGPQGGRVFHVTPWIMVVTGK